MVSGSKSVPGSTAPARSSELSWWSVSPREMSVLRKPTRPKRRTTPAPTPGPAPISRRCWGSTGSGTFHLRVEYGEVIVAEGDAGGGHVLLQVRQRGGARDEQNVRVLVQQPGQGDLGGHRAVLRGDGGDRRIVGERLGPARAGRPDREERDVGDVVIGAEAQDVLVV